VKRPEQDKGTSKIHRKNRGGRAASRSLPFRASRSLIARNHPATALAIKSPTWLVL